MTILADAARTTYLFDVRTPEEFYANGVPGFVHAPGGQLIQATDHWVSVRGARLVLLDDEQVRAPVVAAWLREGRSPTVFIHTPDNVDALELARRFHEDVRTRMPEIEPLPEPVPAGPPTLF